MEFDPFISVDDLEAILGETLADPNSLEVKIALDASCQSVRTYLGQDINLVEDDVEIHSGGWRQKIRLRQRPVRSVTQVVCSGEVIPTTAYSVRGHIISIIDGSLWNSANDNIAVTYTHGWDIDEPSDFNVPTDIRFVALSAARRLFNDMGVSDASSGSIIKESIGDYSYELSEATLLSAGAAGSLGESEKMVLDPYRIELVGDTPTQWLAT